MTAKKVVKGAFFTRGSGNILNNFLCDQFDSGLVVAGAVQINDVVLSNQNKENDKPATAILFSQADNCVISNFKCEGRIEVELSSENIVIKEGKCEGVSVSSDSKGCVVTNVQTNLEHTTKQEITSTQQ